MPYLVAAATAEPATMAPQNGPLSTYTSKPAVVPVIMVPIIPIKGGPEGLLQLPAALSELAMPKYRPT